MFLIIGSDQRYKYTAKSIMDSNYDVAVYANDSVAEISGVKVYDSLSEAIKNNICIVLGIPFSRDNLTLYSPLSDKTVYIHDVLKHITPRHVVTGGKLGDFSLEVLREGAQCVDYGSREDFSLYNAHITAEAVVSLIMNKLPVAVSDLNCLILGYGRIGKALAGKLSCLGANVTVTARKSYDFAVAEVFCVKCMKTSDVIDDAGIFQVIVNTIPAKILSDATFEKLDKSCLLIDASAYPGFLDSDIAGKYGLEVEGAFSMPGKYAPASSGKIIADVILNVCKETDILK